MIDKITPLSLKMFLFGFSNGFCLLLSGYTLNFWLSSLGVNIETIGLFSLVLLPYSFKFLMAPFVDRMNISFFQMGRLRSWFLISQIATILAVFALAITEVKEQSIVFVAFFAFFVSFFSSLQDIVLNSFRIEINDPEKQGFSSGLYTFGYRAGMMISGAGAIALSTKFSWKIIYFSSASILIFLSMIIIFMTRYDEKKLNAHKMPETIKFSIINILIPLIQPLRSVTNAKNLLIIAAFLFLYRIADNSIYVMTNSFLLHLGFSSFEIVSSLKVLGPIGAIIGSFAGGYFIEKLFPNFNQKIKLILLIFGVLHNLTHLLYVLQIKVGHDVLFLNSMIFLESFTGGMAMTSYIAYMSSLCSAPHSATQYAAFSSMMGLSRVILPSFSGFLAMSYDWENFFLLMFALSFLSLCLIPFLYVKR